jgi:hypothetical protein
LSKPSYRIGPTPHAAQVLRVQGEERDDAAPPAPRHTIEALHLQECLVVGQDQLGSGSFLAMFREHAMGEVFRDE